MYNCGIKQTNPHTLFTECQLESSLLEWRVIENVTHRLETERERRMTEIKRVEKTERNEWNKRMRIRKKRESENGKKK